METINGVEMKNLRNVKMTLEASVNDTNAWAMGSATLSIVGIHMDPQQTSTYQCGIKNPSEIQSILSTFCSKGISFTTDLSYLNAID